MEERLQKVIAQAGITSRRDAEAYILEGRVSVNGQIVDQLGFKVDPEKDHIKVDGKLIHVSDEHVYILLNKPKGVVSTVNDPEDRPTVLDLIQGVKTRIYPVGRLDFNTEGALLITNDGDMTNRLLTPKSKCPKTYLVKVAHEPTVVTIKRVERGVTIDGTRYGSCKIQVLKVSNNSWLKVTLFEGKNHQIRKIFEHVGHPVSKLKRVAFSFLTIDGLKTGEWRHLTEAEVERLKKGDFEPKAEINLYRFLKNNDVLLSLRDRKKIESFPVENRPSYLPGQGRKPGRAVGKSGGSARKVLGARRFIDRDGARRGLDRDRVFGKRGSDSERSEDSGNDRSRAHGDRSRSEGYSRAHDGERDSRRRGSEDRDYRGRGSSDRDSRGRGPSSDRENRGRGPSDREDRGRGRFEREGRGPSSDRGQRGRGSFGKEGGWGSSDRDSRGRGDRDGRGRGPSDRDSRGRSDRDSRGYSDRDSRGRSERDSRGYSDRDSRGRSDRDNRGFSDRDSRGRSDRDSRGFSDRDSRGRSDRDSRGPSDRDSRGRSERDSRGRGPSDRDHRRGSSEREHRGFGRDGGSERKSGPSHARGPVKKGASSRSDEGPRKPFGGKSSSGKSSFKGKPGRGPQRPAKGGHSGKKRGR